MGTVLAPQFTQRFYRWTQFKAIASSKSLIYQHEITNDNMIRVWGYDEPEVIVTEIFNGEVHQASIDAGYSQEQNDADKADFLTNYSSKSNREIAILKPFADARLYKVALEGFSGVAVAGTTTEIIHKFISEKSLCGARAILSKHSVDDTIDFEIYDKDGIIAPAGTVLNQFCTNWAVVPDQCTQGDLVFSYVARVYAGLWIRVKYHSTGTEDVAVKINMFTHIRTM